MRWLNAGEDKHLLEVAHSMMWTQHSPRNLERLVMACPVEIVVQFVLLVHADCVFVHTFYHIRTLCWGRSYFTLQVVVLFTLFLHVILVLVQAGVTPHSLC